MASQCTQPRMARWVSALSLFILFMAIGRLASFVSYTPLLAYGNSYDMVRIQACHQIWPAGLPVQDLARATPTAPLTAYVLGQEVETPCFPSSELLFTGLGIELARQLVDEQQIPIRAVGYAKAVALALMALLIHFAFGRQGAQVAQLANALVMLVVLTDPGVTLYLSTFYTEFSAVFFAYLALAGLAILGGSNKPLRDIWWFCIGIAGLALSKPQHLPLGIGLGLLVVVCQVLRGDRLGWLPLLLAIFVPLHLMARGDWMPRNDAMLETNKLNAVAAMVTAAPAAARPYLLAQLGLGEDCLRLKLDLESSNWQLPELHRAGICPELAQRTHSGLALELLTHPRLLFSLLKTGVPRINDWVVVLYGHVEGKEYGDVNLYHWTIGRWVRDLPATAWHWLGGLQVCFSMVFLLMAGLQPAWRGRGAFLGVTGLMSTGMYMVAILGDGFVDIAKHAHLATTLGLAFYLVLIVEILALAGASLLRQGGGLKQG